MPLNFSPWHGATGTVSVSSRLLGTKNTALLHALLVSFSEANVGPGPSETLTPRRGDNLNVRV